VEGKISVVNQLGRAYNGLVISSALQNDKPLRKTGYDFFACTMTGNQRSGAQNRYGLAALCKRVNARDVPRFTGTYSYSGSPSCIPINPWGGRNAAATIYMVISPYILRGSETNPVFVVGFNHVR